MSDNWVQLVPADPSYVPPSDGRARLAGDTLRRLLGGAERIEVESHDSVQFFDAGSNWSGVSCPFCQADLEAWWGDSVGHALQSGVLDTKVPCCGRVASLNDLEYPWGVAFGRFAISAFNPSSNVLSESNLAELAQILGCELRVVLRHI